MYHLKEKKTFVSVFILQTKNEEKTALDKELEWSVNWRKAIRFILSTGEVDASMIYPDFAVILGIFINLVSISENF